jgi:hypothetical protein
MLRFIFKLLRAIAIAAVGTALAAKFLLESNADRPPRSTWCRFEGRHWSPKEPFCSGKIMSMFGGAHVDLRKATPAPTGIYIDLVVVMGGVSLVVPEGWRVKFDGNTIMGGWSDETRTTADDDVPTVTLSGLVFMGGVQAANRVPVEAAV